MYFVRNKLAVGALKTAKSAKMKVKNTKLPILRPIFHLEHCKSINGLKKWLYKQNNTKNVLCKAYVDCKQHPYNTQVYFEAKIALLFKISRLFAILTGLIYLTSYLINYRVIYRPPDNSTIIYSRYYQYNKKKQ